MATLEADVDGDGEFEATGGDEAIVTTRGLLKNANLRVRVKAGAGTTVHVYAAPGRSAGPLTTFSPASDDEQHLVPITLMGDHSWFRVEVRAPGSPSGADTDPNLPDQLRAATSPVFISVRRPADPQPEIRRPAQAAGSDPAALAAGDAGMFTGFADIATEDSIVHAVFERHTGASTSVIYQQMTLGGHHKLRGGKAIEISDGSATARWPRIAISGKDVWVVWQDERGQQHPHRPSFFASQQQWRGLVRLGRAIDQWNRSCRPTRHRPGGRRPPCGRLGRQQWRRLRADSRFRQGADQPVSQRKDHQPGGRK